MIYRNDNTAGLMLCTSSSVTGRVGIVPLLSSVRDTGQFVWRIIATEKRVLANSLRLGLCRFFALVLATVALFTHCATNLSAQGVEYPPTPVHVTSCVMDPGGGASPINQCFRAPNGELHLLYKSEFLQAFPAPQRHQSLMRDACNAMEIDADECDSTAMMVNIGHNAMAALCDGRKVVFFDRNIESLFGQTGSKFAILHELGHHYCGHLDQLCTPENELEADAFAGASLRELGISLEDAMEVLEELNGKASFVYPPIMARANAISSGWAEPELAKNCRNPSGDILSE